MTLFFYLTNSCNTENETLQKPDFTEQPITLVKAPANLLLKSLELYNSGDNTITKQVQKLYRDANGLLNLIPETVVNKTYTPPGGDKRDYVSMAPYWWPNPNTEDGLPYVRKDGKVNPESRDGTFDQVRFSQTCSNIYTLALAFWFSEEVKYRNKALEMIKVWFVNEETRMNPHLKYGQFIPGSSEGRTAGIIETTSLFGVVDAYFLIQHRSTIESETEQSLKNWFRNYREWLFTHEIGIKEGQSRNNHGTWYGAQVSAFGILAGMDTEVKDYMENQCKTRLSLHITSEGKQPEELSRTKTLNYSLMNLRGHLMVANMAAVYRIDLFNFEDQPLKLGLEFIRDNLPPNGDWPYEQIVGISDSHYNDLARMITNYNLNSLTSDKISGADMFHVDLSDWNWLIYGGKPE